MSRAATWEPVHENIQFPNGSSGSMLSSQILKQLPAGQFTAPSPITWVLPQLVAAVFLRHGLNPQQVMNTSSLTNKSFATSPLLPPQPNL